MAYLYRHIRLDTNKPFYIGIGSDDTYKRAYHKFNRNYLWNNIVKKTEYVVEIMLEDDDYDFIKLKEIEFIKLYGRKDLKTGFLTNMTDGGQGRLSAVFSESEKQKRRNMPRGEFHHAFGSKMPEAQKKAISQKLKGVKRPDISAKLKGRKTAPEHLRFGDKNPFYNKKHTEYSKKKMSESTKKWFLTNDNPMKGTKNIHLSNYNKNTKKEEKYWFGRTLSDSHKENLRLANLGKKRTEKTCENNRQAQVLRFRTSKHPRCKIVLNLENGIFYESAKEASAVFGYKKTTLVCMLNGTRRNKTSLIYV